MNATEKELIDAMRQRPLDVGLRLVFADFLEEHGQVKAARLLRDEQTPMTEQEFQNGIIAQNDDEDYDESGYVACVLGSVAFLARYGHCSCYGTWSALNSEGSRGRDREDLPKFDWIGHVEALVEMARCQLDPTVEGRTVQVDDYDADHLLEVYKQVLAWHEQQRTVTA